MNNTMQRPVAGRIFKWLYIAATVVLVFTGFAQMPIMKRYYIADIPGMAWSADYYATLTIHYLAAGLFLALVAYTIVARILSRNIRPAGAKAWTRVVLFALLILSGGLMAAQNQTGVNPPAGLVITASMIHIGATMLFVIAALTWFRFGKKQA